jgi:hypothetical protein
MYRVFALIVNLIAALSIGSIFQSGVTLQVDVPAEVVAGTEFEVRVNIQKGDLESFSRLQQSLPAGLTATSYQSSNADFTFEEKRVRLIWIRLPRQDELTVVYRIKVDERLKGTFDIQGKFSYIEDNERKSVSIESAPITILPSPYIDPALIVDINDYEQQVIPYIPVTSAGAQIACIRQAPVREAGGAAYLVTILVNKESKQKFAKIEEEIPAGYTAIDVDPKEAIFTFKDGKAKFLWMNLPADPYFTVAYKLVPQDLSASLPQLNGKFSYLEGEKTISIDIKQTDRDLASLTPDEVANIIATATTPAIAVKIPPDKETTPEKEVVVKTTPPVEKEKPKASARSSKELKTNLPYLLEPEEGVYYRVQLAAGHRNVDIEKYFKKFNLDKEVRKEYHEGWQKYSIGSFQVYKDARDYRVHIWNTTAIDDAFVSAYNDGNRITVQEALMIANQQWYK